MLTVKQTGKGNVVKYIKAVRVLGSNKANKIYSRAVNKTGGKGKTQVVRALAKQTGLKQATTRRAVRPTRSTPSTLSYYMRGAGGDVSLKYFNPKEQRAGVKASPFGKRTLFKSSFLKGGLFPNRVGLNLGGHVWQRTSKSRTPIEKQKSGVIIPEQMVTGDTKNVFETTVSKELPLDISRALRYATKGVLS